MAEDKSKDSDEERIFEPTPRRLEKAREEGQFPQSRDLTALIALAAFLLVGMIASSNVIESYRELVIDGLRFGDTADWQDDLGAWARGPLMTAIFWTSVFILVIWGVSIFAPLALVSLKPVFAFKFRTDKLNIVKGFGRLFSVETLVETGKNFLKIVLIFSIVALYVILDFGRLLAMFRQDQDTALASAVEILVIGFSLLIAPVVVIAILDVLIQSQQYTKKMRLTAQEFKEELKETEGSPDIRQRRRQRQMQLASQRMMAALEKADVVITNPDHYAVALRYDETRMRSPVIVAKGIDETAQTIKRTARELDIPVAEIPPLARVLAQSLRVGEAVPPLLFESIAEVLAWAYRTRTNPSEDSAQPDIQIDEELTLKMLKTKSLN